MVSKYKEKREDQSIEEYLEEIMPDTNIYIGFGGKKRRGYCCIPFHKLVWNLYHPTDKWQKGFDIHHLDENPLNNSPFNLIKLTRSDHMQYHNLCKHVSKETRQKLSIAKTGENHPNYGMIGEKSPNYGKHRSEETRQKMSENHWDISGAKHPQARAVSINNKIFSTMNEAAKYLNVSPPTIRNRILSKNFSGYSYV